MVRNATNGTDGVGSVHKVDIEMQAVFGMFKHGYNLKFGQSRKFCDSVGVHRVSPLEKLLLANKTLPDRGGAFSYSNLETIAGSFNFFTNEPKKAIR